MEKDNANESSGHLMVSDYRLPRPCATPEELQVRCLPLKCVDAKRSGIKPQESSGNDPIESAHACCRCWRRDSTTRTLVASYDTTSTRMILF